jgi:uncharacterized membrane protein YfcA
LKILAFGLLGFAFGSYALLIILMIASGLLGTIAGKHVLVRIGEKYFKPVLSSILIVLAMRLLWSGVEGFLTTPPT